MWSFFWLPYPRFFMRGFILNLALLFYSLFLLIRAQNLCVRRNLACVPDPFCVELSRHPVDGFSAGLVDDSNVFEWAITIMGPPDTL